MTDTQALLKTYATNRSEDAFRELVTRYIGLVYSTALRQVDGDIHTAEDVSQIVFSDLARDAGRLSAEVMLGGWLHQRALNVARTMMRSERRRWAREKEAVEMSVLEDHTAANLARIGPALDEAITQLNPEDRVAVILRFFERRDLRSIGEVLDINEDAAQKRVSRALDKLRLTLGRGGVTISASALGAVLAAEQVTATPVGLAATVTTVALSATTSTPTAVSIVAGKAIGMATIQKIAVGAVLAAAVGTGIYESRQAATARAERQALQQEQAPLLASIEQLQRELNDATDRVRGMADALAQANSKDRELMALRGEVGRLRQQSKKLAKLDAKEESTVVGSADASWLDRVGRLRQRLEQTPEAQIPKLRFVTDEDWLNAARFKLDTNEDYRNAFERLRGSGEGRFLHIAEKALQKFLKTHHDGSPRNSLS